MTGGGGGGAGGDGAWAMGLTSTWWGCYGLCLTQTNRACPLLFILVLCLFLSFCPFQLYFIPKILPTNHRFLTLFSWFYLCIILSIIYLLMKVSYSSDMIPCG